MKTRTEGIKGQGHLFRYTEWVDGKAKKLDIVPADEFERASTLTQF